ncbi:iron-sulfur protein NUBPL-like isoform X1 [Varroa jacobsoni]|uniref:iron-sulfur protein NUBPL-like isoform X1 n=1 Tax=Varroa jacobsoni TaxID=62625 RepID=UPI000BF2C0DC|nr:iron-sulfur protein NUBPL-like isoform X1 [Varroa jacobsoni]
MLTSFRRAFTHHRVQRLCSQPLSDRVIAHMQKGLPKKFPLPGVNKVVLISSAKGGVGKSTTAVNLAISCAILNYRVGLLDADVLGPSIPQMMNLRGEPELNSQNQMLPLRNYNVRVMSMGFLVNESAAITWRGLMVMQAVQRLLRNVNWGSDGLDVLFVDMPPGTGDVQLSIAQNIPIDGAVIVTTPQPVALLDARRGIEMFRKMNVPILGVVQNMSEHICEKCGHTTYMFGKDGAKKMADDMGVQIIGNIPLNLAIREGCDSGKPIIVVEPDSPVTKAYNELAAIVLMKLGTT